MILKSTSDSYPKAPRQQQLNNHMRIQPTDLNNLAQAYQQIITEAHDETGSITTAPVTPEDVVDPVSDAKANLEGLIDVAKDMLEGFVHNRDYIESEAFHYNLEDLKDFIHHLAGE